MLFHKRVKKVLHTLTALQFLLLQTMKSFSQRCEQLDLEQLEHYLSVANWLNRTHSLL